jgi:phage gpG-like protein
MTLKGDFAKLDALIKRASALPSLMTKIKQHAAIEARRQIRRTFVEGRDPYGKPWAPLKLRKGKPLRLTGALSTFIVERSGDGFIVRATVPYVATHQYGATIVPKRAKWLTFSVGGKWFRLKKAVIPKRQMIPEGTWGSIWTDAITKRVEPLVQKFFGL